MARNRSKLTLLSKAIALRKEFIAPTPMTATVAPCVLFDNGSLQPAATLSLRAIAHRLQEAIGVAVYPASLLHASAVDPGELGGAPARLLEPALEELLGAGHRRLVLLPLFFGPSAALTGYVPARLAHLRARHPAAQVLLGRWLVDVNDPGDARIAAIAADAVRAVIRRRNLARPGVVLVDHGSPRREVMAVRDFVGRLVGGLLAGEIGGFAVASMERRPGPEYAFGDPLLAAQLQRPPFAAGDVVVAPLFVSPGRHAGPDGDLAVICAEAERAQPGLRTHLAGLVGADPRLTAVLADRYAEACAKL